MLFFVWFIVFTNCSVIGGIEYSEFELEKSSKSFVIKIFNDLSQVAPAPMDGLLVAISVNLCLQSNLFVDEGRTISDTSLRISSVVDTILKTHGTLEQSLSQLSEVKDPILVEYLRELDVEVERFKQTIIQFGRNPIEVQVKLDKFITDYKEKIIEENLIKYLSDADIWTKSLKAIFLIVAGANQYSNTTTVRSSPNKMIYDLHLGVLLKIFRSYAFLLGCFELQKALYRENRTKDESKIKEQLTFLKSFFKNKNMEALHSVFLSLRICYAYVDHPGHLIAYNSGDYPVKLEFKNVIQLYVDFARNLNRFTTRKQDDCNIDNLELNFQHQRSYGCYGTIRSCTVTECNCSASGVHCPTNSLFNWRSIQNPTILVSGSFSNTPDRIYSYFSNHNASWSVFDTKDRECLRNNRDLVGPVCSCICDQKKHSTDRFIYAGAIKAPYGYVVTGVRFQKFRKVIFLQPQVGKLLRGGFVDQETIQWISPPSDIEIDVLTLDYDFRRFLLDDVFFEGGEIVTGVQLYQHSNGIILMVALKIFGREIDRSAPHFLSDYETSKVVADKVLLSEKNVETLKPGLEMSLSDLIITRKSKTPIKFGASDEKTDLGQTFVPFLDGVDVVFDVNSPISGIGILHYTNNEQYAGFIKPYLISYNYKNNLDYYEEFLGSSSIESAARIYRLKSLVLIVSLAVFIKQ